MVEARLRAEAEGKPLQLGPAVIAGNGWAGSQARPYRYSASIGPGGDRREWLAGPPRPSLADLLQLGPAVIAGNGSSWPRPRRKATPLQLGPAVIAGNGAGGLRVVTQDQALQLGPAVIAGNGEELQAALQKAVAASIGPGGDRREWCHRYGSQPR